VLFRAAAVFLLLVAPAAALDEMQDEEMIAELLATPPPPPDEAQRRAVKERRWAILPQVGFGPESGPKGGLKFEHRNLLDLGIDIDVHGSYAMNRQQSIELSIGTPHLIDDRFLLLFRAGYDLDPTDDFFGLGNNEVGPDPASTHSDERVDAALVAGWRPWRRLALNLGVGLRKVRIGRGEEDDDDTPFTIDVFPDLPGLEGGWVNPVRFSVVWSTRDNVVRPTRGWRAIGVVSHTNEALLSDFEYTRVVGDVSYLFPIWSERHVFGLRLGAAHIDGPRREVPFWQLEQMGGDDTLRGFFPQRFLGKSRLLGTAEYRTRLFDFDFFRIWHIVVDGAVFGEAGRVFVSKGELRDEFFLDDGQLDDVEDDLRYSYGGGVRFALSQAIIARIDVGFSEEDTGLVYLTFGHVF
jgi:outer membrane protein assembly factor BamA